MQLLAYLRGSCSMTMGMHAMGMHAMGMLHTEPCPRVGLNPGPRGPITCIPMHLSTSQCITRCRRGARSGIEGTSRARLSDISPTEKKATRHLEARGHGDMGTKGICAVKFR